MPRVKKRPPKFAGLFAVAFLVFVGLFLWWRWATAAVDPTSQAAQVFVIPKGQGIDVIGDRLKAAGLIRSRVAFKIIVVKNRLSAKIQAGDFRLRPSMDLETLTQELTHGTLDIWVTLLEGWRREEMAEELEAEFANKGVKFDRQAFLAATQDEEGYLFPDTYLIPRDASEVTIASLLRETFDRKVDFSGNKSGLTPKQVVILASIVEREVRTDKDRPLVAGILLKRFRNDWPLQVDATVQYAVASRNCRGEPQECNWWPQNLTRKDIGHDSPYNTYENLGLPPTPIANPGLASLKAVLAPKPSDYWFYISDSSGNIHYAETIDQHNLNVSKYLDK